ncbi:high affinity immunoglobulin epsilon receptor subunit beta-like isoform X1 [Canis lupus baileyi]|uniref:Membrane spanning 4-domains A2 n=2 Tax=Canis lupus familiaris TaxID=9615 RepID=A0A8I3PFF6_CANLF|nr:high affinity immunoglobulin epsilon receptor subunit beta [Canis lupus familiaris]XP_038285376.1 high affinity immunoglobulin epsilon receptor subunit beta isoform X1 [Canis lupus familiaris]XP_038285377.1 high affinity immunoglobulin epsilon receptor subunit beta isoform X1 [Canis lupus familiaris]XP_038285378.1 high affinity immunoglobulin epsilon receptor subunit beta isoform X1 [Canis lupus familiaris]XP_038285379.1 high affinity immunoglobulin epsilon receptor subunit beta isoform X1 [
MEPENSGRAGLALPNPQGPSSAPEIELSEVPLRENPLLEKAGSSPPCHTWLMFLKRELEFLGVTQILIALVCLCFGIIVCSVINISEFKEDIFSSFKAGYPFWGAVFFAISGFLPIMSEKKHATYLAWGSLGANTVSSIAAGIGIFILTVNLQRSSAYIHNCQQAPRDDFCFVACFSTEIVAMILFLTILGFCSAVSLTIYGVGELVQGNKIVEDRLYEELNIYSPIYSELEDKAEESSPVDS